MDLQAFTQFAATTQQSGNLLGTLGIEPIQLVFQGIAFLLVVFVLGKFVFPVFTNILEKRQAAIDESNKAVVEATKRVQEMQDSVSKMLKEAKDEAGDIVRTAKDEANDLLTRAEHKSRAHAEAIVTAAKADVQNEIAAAKKSLHNEMVMLVAQATEKVASEKLSGKADEALIRNALKELK